LLLVINISSVLSAYLICLHCFHVIGHHKGHPSCEKSCSNRYRGSVGTTATQYSLPHSLPIYPASWVTQLGLPTDGADMFNQEEEGSATYTHACPINGSSTTLTDPTLGICSGPAHEASLSADA